MEYAIYFKSHNQSCVEILNKSDDKNGYALLSPFHLIGRLEFWKPTKHQAVTQATKILVFYINNLVKDINNLDFYYEPQRIYEQRIIRLKILESRLQNLKALQRDENNQ